MTASSEASSAWRLFQLLVMTAAMWAIEYARMSLGPLQEALRIDLALSDRQIAWLQGPAVFGPMALGAIPIGLVVDRYRRAPLFVLFVALSFGSLVLTGFASSFALLFCGRVLAGLALASIIVAAYSLVGDLYAPAQRGRATMVVHIGSIAGAPAAFALGGMLLAMAGSASLGSSMANWRWALLWMSVLLLPVMLLTLALREPPRTGVVIKNPPLREVWPEFWRYRAMILSLLSARTMVWLADGAIAVWGAPILARQFGLPSDRIGGLMALVFLLSGVLGPLLGGPLADLCQRTGGPRRTVTALCLLALASAPAAAFALMPSAAFAAAGIALFLSLGYVISVVGTALGTIVMPGELRGLYIAVTVTCAGFFAGGGPIAASELSSALGGPKMLGMALLVLCGGTSVVSAILFRISRRYFPPHANAVVAASRMNLTSTQRA